MMLHHTAASETGDPAAQIRGFQAYHQGLGWPDIAYHFLVDRSGTVYQGRDPGTRGDTATNYDPTGYFLVCLNGNFDVDTPTDAQLEAAARLFAWGSATYGVGTDVAGHRELASTACPGGNLFAVLQTGRIEQRVADLLGAGGVRLDVSC